MNGIRIHPKQNVNRSNIVAQPCKPGTHNSTASEWATPGIKEKILVNV